jgi:hypothetical protein
LIYGGLLTKEIAFRKNHTTRILRKNCAEMARKSHIYILGEYVNKDHFTENVTQFEHISSIAYIQSGFKIELSESNSLVEDKYSLNLNSAKYVVEGNITETKEAMIHHHPKGHPWRHLQFTLRSTNEKIRIKLEPLDDEDYKKCIKGFLHISQSIIEHEQKDNKVKENLVDFFFNDNVTTLSSERQFLLEKIKQAFNSKGILDDSNKNISKDKIESLKKESHLLPFLAW